MRIVGKDCDLDRGPSVGVSDWRRLTQQRCLCVVSLDTQLKDRYAGLYLGKLWEMRCTFVKLLSTCLLAPSRGAQRSCFDSSRS